MFQGILICQTITVGAPGPRKSDEKIELVWLVLYFFSHCWYFAISSSLSSHSSTEPPLFWITRSQSLTLKRAKKVKSDSTSTQRTCQDHTRSPDRQLEGWKPSPWWKNRLLGHSQIIRGTFIKVLPQGSFRGSSLTSPPSLCRQQQSWPSWLDRQSFQRSSAGRSHVCSRSLSTLGNCQLRTWANF